MILQLPYPPTANLYWRVFRGRPVKSAKAREYQRKVQLLTRAQLGPVKPLESEVSVIVSVYRPKKIGDLDNTLKVLLDSLRGVVYVDDSQIVELVATRRDDKDNPRAVVTVAAVEGR
jgi:crossover junction endodeoxyribonuclease RusA